MLYLLLAIVSSALISIVMRISEKHVKNEMTMFMVNYGICIILALVHLQDKSQLQLSGDFDYRLTLLLGCGAGILYLVNFIFLKFNMAHNGVVMSTTFMKLGVLVPTLMAIFIFREMPKAIHIIGILIAVCAIVLIHFEKDALSESKNKIWLLLLLFLSGFTDSMANTFEKLGDERTKDIYLFLTFGVAFLIALVITICKKEKVSGRDVLFGILIGIPNYYSARFLLASLAHVPAVVVYPVYSVATIVTVMIVGVLAFRERMGKKKMIAMGLIFLALVLLNL